jgi:hypothetical protein
MKLKTLLGLSAFCAATITQTYGNTVTLGANNSNYRVGSGGEFNWIPNGGNPDGFGAGYAPSTLLGSGFESFCIQVGEHIGFGGTYEYAISSHALGPTGTDEISKGTAWLYSQFATGTLAGYNYTPGAGRATSAGALQNAIWYLEGEIANPGANIFLTAAYGAFINEAGAKLDASGAYGVYALNLGPVGTKSDWSNQDQLIYRGVPDGGMTVVLLGLGLLGLAIARRRT